MGEVGVGLEDEVVAALERPGEPRQIGPSQARLLFTVEHVDPRIGGRELVRQLAGAVRGAVVHHQDLQAGVLGQDLGDDPGKVLALVVGRENHQEAVSHRRRDASGGAGSG